MSVGLFVSKKSGPAFAFKVFERGGEWFWVREFPAGLPWGPFESEEKAAEHARWFGRWEAREE